MKKRGQKHLGAIAGGWLLALTACAMSRNAEPPPAKAHEVEPISVITGFNQNWSFLPALDSVLLHNIARLKPEMLRYPGGTTTHRWEWKLGAMATSKGNKPTHPLSDIKLLTAATGADMIFVLDVVHHSLEDQVQMLESIRLLGVPVEYIELGNELYAKDEGYEVMFPTGAAYADTVNSWTPRLKAAFPDAQIGAVLLGRSVKSSNTKLFNWNTQVVSGIDVPIDAFIYHVYISENDSAANTIADFKAVALAAGTGSKALWITEYGNMNALERPDYLQELTTLADFIESCPQVTIALNHLLIAGKHFNKLHPDGATFTPEGELFLKRVN